MACEGYSRLRWVIFNSSCLDDITISHHALCIANTTSLKMAFTMQLQYLVLNTDHFCLYFSNHQTLSQCSFLLLTNQTSTKCSVYSVKGIFTKISLSNSSPYPHIHKTNAGYTWHANVFFKPTCKFHRRMKSSENPWE